MRHLIFAEASTYPIALLVKGTAFNKDALLGNYVIPLQQQGIGPDQMIGFTLKYNEVGKAPVKFIKEYLDNLLSALDQLGTRYLYVTDSAYFKVLAGQTKAEPHYGYCLPCKVKGYEHMQVILGLNHQALIYNPDLQSKLSLSLNTLASSVQGSYQKLGQGIIHSASYPERLEDIAAALDSLHQYSELTCDIEAFSLQFDRAGIGTIGFAWDQHNGLSFACDYTRDSDALSDHYPGCKKINLEVRALLKRFFQTYQGRITWHNSTFDIKVIIYTLWMQDTLDYKGLLEGLHCMCKNFDDTKVIAYLATNSTAGNVLGLKSLAHEFAGNYAQEEIHDIRKIPLKELREYNLVDCLSTWFVKNKFTPIMRVDRQEELYRTLMLPSLKVIIQMELVGMPMIETKIAEVRAKLEAEVAECQALLDTSPVIKMLNLVVQTKAMEAANAKLKTKQHPLEKFADKLFNAGSGKQLQILLYEQMGLPVIDYTITKQPATGADTLEKLIHHTEVPEYREILQALIRMGKASKILSTFIPAFEAGIRKADGRIYLHGGFNLGGTVSGRLSSSKPNMQQLPSGSTFGKLIKSCFTPAKGWLLAGADYNSLEDYISALTTKDPNKLNVYLRKFDGHCLRAAYYFRDQLPHIDLEDPASVNSIKKTHPELRQDSKAPTFLLTYGGTYHGMMSNLGWPEDKSKSIEENYHTLYKISDEYVAARLKQACSDGYVEVAFGLRVRTPLLKQVIWGSSQMPYEAAAEGRTAGNALGQSYGLLNNRAAVEFMEKVWASEFSYTILPVALIHDSIYLLIKDDLRTVEWVNRELIKSMQWQELPEIQHDLVKLGAELDVHYENWAQPITIPNNASIEKIQELCSAGVKKYNEDV